MRNGYREEADQQGCNGRGAVPRDQALLPKVVSSIKNTDVDRRQPVKRGAQGLRQGLTEACEKSRAATRKPKSLTKYWHSRKSARNLKLSQK